MASRGIADPHGRKSADDRGFLDVPRGRATVKHVALVPIPIFTLDAIDAKVRHRRSRDAIDAMGQDRWQDC